MELRLHFFVILVSLILNSSSLANSDRLPHCFAHQIDYDVLRITEKGAVWLNISWPGSLNVVDEPYYYLIRYGVLPKHSSAYRNISPPNSRIMNVSQDISNVMVTDINLDREYGIQVCGMYAESSFIEPRWEILPEQHVKITTPGHFLACVRSVKIEKQVLDEAATHYDAIVSYDDDELIHEMHWLRWGEAEKIKNELIISKSKHLEKIATKTNRVILKNLSSGKIYGIQICSFHDTAIPIEILWQHQKTFLVVTEARHAEPEKEESYESENDRHSFFLVIVISAITGIFLIAVVASLVCHRVAGNDEDHGKSQPSTKPASVSPKPLSQHQENRKSVPNGQMSTGAFARNPPVDYSHQGSSSLDRSVAFSTIRGSLDTDRSHSRGTLNEFDAAGKSIMRDQSVNSYDSGLEMLTPPSTASSKIQLTDYPDRKDSGV